ncbi:MAG TPA: isoprenylcysteine carboxylmethyltransferase family protein [Pyrinomonadaceae bacterium]|nr:isoprenylcysteine carboxylmethyltransferase family protein [Pyrinomonadaceae bacterium]
MDHALRIILPLYLLGFFGIAFVWRSFLVWKRTGINPYVVGKTDKPIDFIENIYRIPVLLLIAVTIVFAFLPGVYQYSAPILWLENSIVKIAGFGFMIFALIWTATAQMQMGKSWRIGIDTENKTDLVEKGLFTVSRNPIFFGMRTALFGFFLCLPNALTLLAVVLADVLMQIQVRLEEEFLKSMHGESYENYCRKVRRWI